MVQNANAAIIAVPRTEAFGPNDPIQIDLNITNYVGGWVSWVAHRPDKSILSGYITQFKEGVSTHQITRSAFDNEFGDWSIDYNYNNLTQAASFKVLPISLSAITDKEIYYEPDTMNINITTSYFNPVAATAEFYHLNFYDSNGNTPIGFKQIDIRATQQNTVFSFPIIDLVSHNPPGQYNVKIQYYNVITQVPFLVGDINKLIAISATTDKQVYYQGDSVDLNLHFSKVVESMIAIKITDPLGNTTKTNFPVSSQNTNLHLTNLTAITGTYSLEMEYSGVTQTKSFQVVSNPAKLPNIDLEIFLNKLKYRPGEMIYAKVTASSIVANSISFWFEDPNGKQSSKITIPMTAERIIPHRINSDDLAGQWKMYINYDGLVRVTNFVVYELPVGDSNVINMITTPKFLMEFGSDSGSNLKNPRAIALDSLNNIYIADTGNSEIKKFDAGGKLLLTWGSFGSANGQFRNPSGIFVNQKYVYVADTGNARIEKFDKNGNFVYAWGAYGYAPEMFQTPVALAEDVSGNLFVSDSGENKIQIFDSNGNYIGKISPILTDGANFSETNSIGFDSKNNFYIVISDENKILKYDRLGNFIDFIGSAGNEEGRFNHPSSIAIDSNDNIYVTDENNYRIQKFDPDGNFLVSWGSQGTNYDQFQKPVSITADSTNNIYVIDEINNNVQKFSPYGPPDITVLPNWVKNYAKWWAEGALVDTDFASDIHYITNQGKITSPNGYGNLGVNIPAWIKHDAGWWADGQIDDNTFENAIKFLVSNGIIKS